MAQTDARRAWDRARHAREKEKRNAARRAAHAANPERLRAVDRARYKANPNRKRGIDIKSKYGTYALEVYLSANSCDACGRVVSGKGKHIDHDHSFARNSREAFRGILCASCNLALGHLEDDAKRIDALARYVTRAKLHKTEAASSPNEYK